MLIARGERLQDNEINNVYLNYGGVLKRVLHISDLKAHLILVQKLVSDNGCQFTIHSDSYFLTNKVLHKKTGFIKWARGLLLLEDQVDLCFNFEGK